LKKITFWSIARRPQWVFGFFVALLAAFVLGLLATWQWDRGVQSPNNPTEDPVALLSVQQPSTQTVVEANGRMVTVTAKFDNAVFIVANRVQDDRPGYWVSARFIEAQTGAQLFVALGFTENPESFCALNNGCTGSALLDIAITQGGSEISLDQAISLLGRFSPPETPNKGDGNVWNRFATMALINTPELDSAGAELFSGFLIQSNLEVAGLETIKTVPAPIEPELNWLNIFYAIEWVFFAGFSVYVWYRLVRDDMERHQDAPAEAGAKAELSKSSD